MDGRDPHGTQQLPEPHKLGGGAWLLVVVAPVRNRYAARQRVTRSTAAEFACIAATTLLHDVEELNGIPITTVPRILLDLARIGISDRALARAVREAVRLKHTTPPALTDFLIAHERPARYAKARADPGSL